MERLLDRELLSYYNQDILANTGILTLFREYTQTNNLKNLFEHSSNLLKKHSENIVLHNMVERFMTNLTPETANEKKKTLHNVLVGSNASLAKTGAKKIKSGSKVFVHSLNNQVFEVIRHSARYKTFEVNMVEHPPYELGRHFLGKLKKLNISSNQFPGVGVGQAIKTSDICFIGAEAITPEGGAIAKIGSNSVADNCEDNHVPVYVCAHTWKADLKNKVRDNLLKRSFTDKGHTTELFEYLSPKKITSYVSEQGITSPKHIIQETLFNRSL